MSAFYNSGMKDFNEWNNLKKKLNERSIPPFANRGDIWWCSIGLNVGSEQDGKNELFERPVLVLEVFNSDMLRVAPLTSKTIQDRYRLKINYDERWGVVVLSQIKTISPKRLSRKITSLDISEFQKVIQVLRSII
jgi:mRNA-degrading endonuclease toxin of MazEF toxin-antitoxin module